MIYCYRCPDGHATEAFRSVANRNRKLKCSTCGKATKRDMNAEYMSVVRVIPDIPEHVNPFIPGSPVVRGRAHLRELQAKHGLHDYDPKDNGGPPSDWK